MLSRRSLLISSASLLARAAAAQRARWEPKVAENIGSLDDETLAWLAQLGLKWVDLQGAEAVDRDKKGWWSVGDIRAVQQRCRQFGMELASITVPIAWQTSPLLGKPDRDRDIENIRRSIRAVGEAAVPVFQYRCSPDFKWGPEMGYKTVPGRGGAGYTAFDFDLVKDSPPFEDVGPLSYDQLWERFIHLVKAMVDVAEPAGVKLSVHPKDPPQPVVRGVARLFTNIDQMERFLDAVPSPASGFTFCQGTITEMGVDVLEAIRRIGRRGRIHHVHFRAVRGRVPKYVETFIDEGDIDMLAAMRAYKEVGYTGAMVSDHTPRVTGDVAGGKIGRSFSHGYIRALIQAVNAGG